MNLSDLTDPIIKRMSPAARKAMRLQTSDEAQSAFSARSERELQTQIASLLRLRGIWFCTSRMDRKTTTAKGVPDFLLVAQGVPLAFEVKHGKGKLSPEQVATHEVMTRNGWRVHVVRELGEVRGILDNNEETNA